MSPARQFSDYDPSQGPLKEMPLLIGITGPSFSGKSYSAEELARGIQRVYGGQIYHVDTENDRALELHKRYGGPFEFRHVPFPQPKSPEEYEQVVRFCLGKSDCGVVIVDTMSHEHLAVLNMMEDYMERKGAGDDWQKRDKLLFASMVIPKGQRKRLNELIAFGNLRADGRKVPMILLYRAQDKTKPGKSRQEGGDGKPIHKGWQAETSSDLPFYMTARFLLPPGSDGHPNLSPDTEWERLSIKNPQQFRGWFKEGFQLTAEVGERLARWALSKGAQSDPERPSLLEEVRQLIAAKGGSKEKAAALQAAFGMGWSGVQALPSSALRDGLAKLRPTDSPPEDSDLPPDDELLERHEIAQPFGDDGAPAVLPGHKVKHLLEMAELRLGTDWQEALGDIVERATGQRELAACPATRETDIMRGIKDEEVRRLKEDK